jgi:GntR family transcriptional regulator, transcriptional repressor for pyruvate dehydrogenase complex
VTDEPRGRAPAYQVLADELRDQITSGRLRPGQRLPTEPELCVRSGVSRSTVREALRLLSSQQLIVTTRGVTGGSFVAQPSAARLAESMTAAMRLLLATSDAGIGELMEIRELLEVPAAGLAAQRRTEADLVRLRAALVDSTQDGGDLPGRVAAHRAFHSALAAAAGNPLYELVAGPLYAAAEEARLAQSLPTDSWRQIDVEHREILSCVSAGDVLGAQRATTWHLARLRSAWPRRPRPRSAPEAAPDPTAAGTGGVSSPPRSVVS